MVQYQVWIEDEAYAKRAILLDYLRLTYKIVINGMGYATIEMDPADPKIAELVMGRRLKVIRDGKIVFGGRLLREGWSESDDSPAGFSWSVHAVDYAHYAKRRIVVPEAGQTHQTYTDHADDVAKDFVRNNLGSGAVEARRFPDLTVEAAMTGGQSLPAVVDLSPQGQQMFELDKPLRDARDAFEKAYFEFHLAQEGGSMTRVAEKTGLERTHLYRKLKQLGVDLARGRRGGGNHS